MTVHRNLSQRGNLNSSTVARGKTDALIEEQRFPLEVRNRDDDWMIGPPQDAIHDLRDPLVQLDNCLDRDVLHGLRLAGHKVDGKSEQWPVARGLAA